MSKAAFQDLYPEDVQQCYGCGALNEHGHQIKSYWDGDETVCTFQPKPYHTAIVGYVYGGLIASLIDCHGTGSAAAAMHRHRGGKEGEEIPRFVTAALHVNYLKPTPMGPELVIRGTIEEIKGRKVVVSAELSADGVVCATGKVVCVEMPEGMLKS
ncbi:MAG TPA: PaaI family thioesterase [Candidatus Krumholzibacteria bacterium]|nr:PaaI family thioesterase [Candidatus Krumholzibacteria bacterium]